MKNIAIAFLFVLLVWLPNEVGAQQRSLQQQIDEAEQGATIDVPSGVYEPIVIRKAVTLRSRGPVIIRGRQPIVVTANDVTIKGFRLEATTNVRTEAALTLNGKRLRVEKTTIVAPYYGVLVDRSERVTIRGVTISGPAAHFSLRNDGVHMTKSKYVTVENSTITSVKDGVYLDVSQFVTLRNNTVTDSRYGYHVMFTNDVTVQTSTLARNIIGLMMMNSKRLQATNNEFREHLYFNSFGAQMYEMGDVTLRHNRFRGNQVALSIEQLTNGTIAHNTLQQNVLAVQWKGGNRRVQLTNNDMMGNVTPLSLTTNEAIGTAIRHNYWDDYDSLDVNGDGFGETPYYAGAMFDQLVERQRELQFFYESPALSLWTAMEKWLPSVGAVQVVDEAPRLHGRVPNEEKQTNIPLLIGGLISVIISSFIYWRGVKQR